MPNVHTPYIQTGLPIPSRQRVLIMRIDLSTGINMTMRFNLVGTIHIYGRSIPWLGQHKRNLTAVHGPTIQVLIL